MNETALILAGLLLLFIGIKIGERIERANQARDRETRFERLIKRIAEDA